VTPGRSGFCQIDYRVVCGLPLFTARTPLANPKDKFKIGIRKLIENLMIQRLGENDKIVTRYVEDQDFRNAAFDGLADEIFDSVVAGNS
jgi:hypothetical protein